MLADSFPSLPRKRESSISRRSSAFTLIELLIVIAILSLLASIAIPAIQAAARMSQTSTCAAHLDNLGVAMHSVSATDGRFPPGVSISLKGPLFTDPGIRMHSYVSYLLPHLDAGVSSLYNHDVNFADTGNHPALRAPLPTLLCPSAPSRDTAPSHEFVPSLLLTSSAKEDAIVGRMVEPMDRKFSATFEGALSDYTVIAMIHKDPIRAIGLEHQQNWGLGRHGMFPYPLNNIQDLIERGKKLVLSSNEDTFETRLALADITDGASNTIMMVEAAGRPERWQHGKRTKVQEPVEGGAWGDVRGPLQINGLQEDRLCVLQCDNRDEMYSFHSGGANFLFADGHVEFLAANMDPRVLFARITPHDGDNVGE